MCICRMGSTDMSEPKNKTLASPCGDYNLQLENKTLKNESMSNPGPSRQDHPPRGDNWDYVHFLEKKLCNTESKLQDERSKAFKSKFNDRRLAAEAEIRREQENEKKITRLEIKTVALEIKIDNMKLNNAVDKDLKWYM